MVTPIKMEMEQNGGKLGFRSVLFQTTLDALAQLQEQTPALREKSLEQTYRRCVLEHAELFDEELRNWAGHEGSVLHRLDETGTYCCAAIGSMLGSIKQARDLALEVSNVFHNHPLPRRFCCSMAETLVLLRGGSTLDEVRVFLESGYALDFRTESKDPVQTAFQTLLRTSSKEEAYEEADLLEEGPAFLAAAMIDAVYGGIGNDISEVDRLQLQERLRQCVVPALHVEQGLHRFYLQMKDQSSIDAMLDGLVDGLAQNLQVYLPIEACAEHEPESFLVPDGRRMKLQRVKGPHDERIQPVFTSMKEVRKSPCRETMRKSLESVLQEFKSRTDVNRIGLNLFDEGLLMDEHLVGILLDAWWKTVDRAEQERSCE